MPTPQGPVAPDGNWVNAYFTEVTAHIGVLNQRNTTARACCCMEGLSLTSLLCCTCVALYVDICWNESLSACTALE